MADRDYQYREDRCDADDGATVDELLTAEVQRRYWQRWNEDNQGAIADYNARIERDGTFSQRIQRFLAQQPPLDGPV